MTPESITLETEETGLATTDSESASPRTGIVNNRRFAIAADVVRAAIAHLPTEQQDVLMWFFGYLRATNPNAAQMGMILRKSDGTWYSQDSIKQLLSGGRFRRGENVEPMLEAIEKLRTIEQLREGQVNSGFIHTRLYREIEKRLQKALKRQKITCIWGASQIGKTESLRQYQREHNHGETIYIEVPTGGGLGMFLRRLALEFNIPANSSSHTHLVERLIECFTGNMLLIVDEVHRALAHRSVSAMGIFDFLRELWNRKRCAICLSMTDEGRDAFQKGPGAKALQQLWRRRIAPLQLPPFPPDDDAALFAQAYGLPPAEDEPVSAKVTFIDTSSRTRTKTLSDSPLRLQRHVLATEGLGVWITILQDAADMAHDLQKPITWGAVLKAHAQSLADGEMLQ